MLYNNRPVSPKMFTNERLFTIQAFTITRVHCTIFGIIVARVSLNMNFEISILTAETFFSHTFYYCRNKCC